MPMEPFEDALAVRRADAGPFVLYIETRPPVGGHNSNGDSTATVAARVLDEVGECTRQRVAITANEDALSPDAVCPCRVCQLVQPHVVGVALPNIFA